MLAEKPLLLNEDEIKTIYLLIIDELVIAPDIGSNIETLEKIKKKIERLGEYIEEDWSNSWKVGVYFSLQSKELQDIG